MRDGHHVVGSCAQAGVEVGHRGVPDEERDKDIELHSKLEYTEIKKVEELRGRNCRQIPESIRNKVRQVPGVELLQLG